MRGTLFEHMFPKDERKARAGVGIQMMGKFARVTSYADIKASVAPAIALYLEETKR